MTEETTGKPQGKPARRSPGGGRTRPPEGDLLAPSGRIGAQLRALYDAIEREPVPSELIELLERLDEAEKRQTK